MDFSSFANALFLVLEPLNILIIFCSVVSGIIIGALPGLTVVMACALLVPLTYGFPTVQSFLSLMGIYCGAVYGGSISAILVGIPGTPAAAATMLDGFAMSKKGLAGKALGVACIASSSAGIMSAIIMTVLSPQLAKISLLFGPAEYFGLAFFALSILVLLSGKSLLKGFTAIIFGLLLTVVGIEPVAGTPRFTFGIENLTSGFRLIPVAVGLFGFSQVFDDVSKLFQPGSKNIVQKIVNQFPSFKELKKIAPQIFKSGIIGTFIGIIPGVGPETASFVGYAEAKMSSKDSDKFGTGVIEAVAAPEAGNNGVTGGAMIPMLTLGIPGDAPTALLLGALVLHGLPIGPMLFRDHIDVVYPIFAGFIVANIFMGIAGLLLARHFAKILNIRQNILMPIICVFCFIGAYATTLNLFDVFVALAFGLIGLYFKRNDYPLSPVLVAIILGPILEMNMANALTISGGKISVFFLTPVGTTFIILAMIPLVIISVKRIKEIHKIR